MTSKPAHPTHDPLRSLLFAVLLLLASTSAASGQTVSGTYIANGQQVKLSHVLAIEVDSDTEPGYMDVLVVLTDREITEEQARDQEALEELSFKSGLSAVRLVLDPDCKVKQIGPYHPSFKVFLVNHSLPQWTPSAFDETVAGRLRLERQSDYGQSWEYDITFAAPIVPDPDVVDTSAPR